jgi:2-polyprenyl-3-methyl-5-hydroxy-6-metoxy-1,4-benzoquinol methylase
MTCPICNKETRVEDLEKRSEFKLIHCLDCDVIFSDPMKTPGAEWYEDSPTYTMGRLTSSNELSWHHEQFINKNKNKPGTVLDVGCGSGSFIYVIKKYGFDVYGIDFDKYNIESAKTKFGLDKVYVSTVEDFRKINTNKKFDYITVFEVIEHVENPSHFLQQLKPLLKPDGIIAMSMPNRDRWIDFLGDNDYPPHHMTKWNEKSVSNYVEINSMRKECLKLKKLDECDIAGLLRLKLKFNIVKNMVSDANKNKRSESGQNFESVMNKAKFLHNIREMFFGTVEVFLKYLILPINIIGILDNKSVGLYCEAKLK